MDKNTILFFVCTAATLVGYTYLTAPTPEQKEARQRYYDSIRVAQKTLAENEEQSRAETAKPIFNEDDSDSIKLVKSAERFGVFSQNALLNEENVTLENDLVKVDFSNLGATVKNVTLKEYVDYKKDPLVLFSENENSFSLKLSTTDNRTLNSSEMKFNVSSRTDTSVIFKLQAKEGSSIDFVYTLPTNSYMVDFDVRMNNMDGILVNSPLNAQWSMSVPQHEKGRKFESRYAQMYYNTLNDGIDYLSETSNDNETISEPLRWIAFKDQYFSSILIADKSFSSSVLDSKIPNDSSKYIKFYNASIDIPYEGGNSTIGMRYFFGPNQYKLLKSYDKELSGDQKLNLKRIIPLGAAIFRWVNQIFSIPLFNFLGGFIGNYGIIILIMTIVMKIIIFPLTYKSYLSSAKMRVLKPQIDEINAKYPADKQTERSQATMELYSKAGVNPMGGCLPMLLQMPILVALFYFFPNAIELRGESFLWAEDLSTYDAFISWNKDIWLIGDHLSLFCLLMTITNIIYTKINMASTDTGQMGQFPFMKYMMYFMPLMFLFIFNDYSSGLSYYYFVSLLITIIQTFIIRKYFVDEEKLLKQIQENQKKPMKKSTWLSRIEEMQKQQQAMMEQQKKQNRN
ncbi:MAG: membrane protein insertase YidC [Paludibacteraceae bacterium]|nr:membrane protein insertase YidC [Paludibacteraceae bacterium]